jgi:hypothetical protein
MPTLSPGYIPYNDGTLSVEVVTARHEDADIESCLSPVKDGKRSVEVVTARLADADIGSCLSPVQRWDTVGGSGDSQAYRYRY